MTNLPETPASPAPAQRLKYIDGFRGFVALYIVLHHMYYENRTGLEAWNALLYARFAVEFFMVISGFALMLSYLRKSEKPEPYFQYLQKRARRLLPPYYVGLIFSLVLILLFLSQKEADHWSASLPVTGSAVLSTFLLVQNFTPYISKINHAYWFMPLIWQISIVFPLLAITLRRITPIPFIFLSLVLGKLLFYYQAGTILSRGQFHFIALFCIGMAAASLVQSSRLKVLFGSIVARLLVILMSLYYVFHIMKIPGVLGSRMLFMDFFSGFLCASILIVFYCGNGFMKKIFELRPIVFVGLISYSLYLTHAPVIALLRRYALNKLPLDPQSAFIMLMAIGIPLCIAVAWCFYRLCERDDSPVQRLFARF